MKTHKKRRRLRKEIRLALLGLAGLFIVGACSMGIYRMFRPVAIEKNPIHVEYKSKYDPKDAIRYVFLGNKENVEVKGNLDSEQLGEQSLTFIYKNKEYPATFKIADTTPPQVTFKDVQVDTKANVTADLFIKSIKDASETKISFLEKKDVSKEGDYTLKVRVSDAYDNTTEEKVHLKRMKDTTAPTFKKMRPYTFKQGLEPNYQKGLKVKDDLDPNPEVEVDASKINIDKPGKYKVTYTVTDRSGNQSKQKRSVIVKKNPEYNQKVVYLTFDDGPSQNTKEVLKILKKYNVKATFFVTGTHPEYNKFIQQAHKDGHTIGLHTYTHDYASIYASPEAYFEDLNKIQDMVYEITGEQSKIIRFPGGSSNTISASTYPGLMSRVTESVLAQGYQFFDWDIDSTDASGHNVPAEQIVQNSTGHDFQYINILMHDTDAKDTTIEALPQIIQHYQERGYIFLGLTTDSYAPHHGVNN